MLERTFINIISGRHKGFAASIMRALLGSAELPYRLFMRIRNHRYDSNPAKSRDLKCATISVGNITAGGTGKTPIVQWLVGELRQVGYRPAVLMRGYRKGHVSDEQSMLQQALPKIPIIANPNRIAGARAALRSNQSLNCFILDDGFQHRRVKRNFDLVLIDATRPFGFGHVHPRGLLREPLDGLNRASAILITHASEVSADKLLDIQKQIHSHTSAPIFLCDHINRQLISGQEEARNITDLANIPFLLFTGIGQPDSLLNFMQQFSCSCKGHRLYDDHHDYTSSDIKELFAAANKAGAMALLTTEKDWAKLKHIYYTVTDPLPIYRLGLEIRFLSNEQELLTLIINALVDY